MAGPFAEQFMTRLQEIEASGDVEPLAALFADDAELSNLAHREPARGPDGTRRFWRDYLSAFGQVRSRFDHVTESDGTAVLEWVSDGELPTGRPFSYRGVSVVEHDGERVTRFRTYYDSAAFVTKEAAPGERPA